MNSQQLLLINFLIFTALVLYFVLGRSKGKQGPALNLTKPLNADKLELHEKTQDSESEKNKPAQDLPPEVTPIVQIVEKTEAKVVFTKKEIVYFIFNGHEWEAHEVLGLKSGVSLEEATRVYQDLIKTSDPSTFEFYEAAFSAILKLKRPKW